MRSGFAQFTSVYLTVWLEDFVKSFSLSNVTAAKAAPAVSGVPSFDFDTGSVEICFELRSCNPCFFESRDNKYIDPNYRPLTLCVFVCLTIGLL